MDASRDLRDEAEPDDSRRELEKMLRSAFNIVARRDFINPSIDELNEIKARLAGITLDCPKSMNALHANLSLYHKVYTTATLQIAISVAPSGFSQSSPGGHIKINVRRISDPEHLQLALDSFPCVIIDKAANTICATRRPSGSCYFYGLKNGESYQFR